MPLLNVVITLVVVGVILWAINAFIPMPPALKSILNVVVVIVVCLWLLQVFGVIGDVGGVRLGGMESPAHASRHLRGS